jgi:hypothetical protein
MKKSIFSYFTFYIFLLSFVTISYISIDSSFRRTIIGLSLGFINSYYAISIENHLIKENNLNKAVRKLEQQIKITDFLTTKSKNSFLDNIYFNANKIEKFIKSDQEYMYLSNIIKNLIEKDPKIYNAIIWDAKLMYLNKIDVKKILKRIDQAINLSPSSTEAYRFALDFTFKHNKQELFKKYCIKYHTSLLGSKHEKDNFSFFGSSSLGKFAIQIEPTSRDQEFYIIDGINLNKEIDYTVILKNPKDLESLNLISNFFPGVSIDVTKISIVNKENNNINLPLNRIYFSSKESFFQVNEGKIKIITTSKNDELINIKLDKQYKNISKIILKINFSRLNLTNYTCK